MVVTVDVEVVVGYLRIDRYFIFNINYDGNVRAIPNLFTTILQILNCNEKIFDF